MFWQLKQKTKAYRIKTMYLLGRFESVVDTIENDRNGFRIVIDVRISLKN